MTKEQFGASMPDIPVFSATDMQYVLNEKRSLELRLSHLSAVNEKQSSILKQLIEEGCCWEPKNETELRGDIQVTEIPCGECPYCRATKLADEMGEK